MKKTEAIKRLVKALIVNEVVSKPTKKVQMRVKKVK